jgi:4-amino-4-deoxy-L-arabinose transferase-like glycosyltransferase
MESRSAPFAHGPTARESELSGVYGEGIVAGLLGAATIAVWFLIVDTINGQPLHTPTVLGTALFRGGAGLDHPQTLPVSYEMVMAFTWVHGLIFAAIGGVAARLLAFAEHTANVGFGIVLLFVIFEFGFVAVTMVFAEDVLQVLAWPAVLVGNLLAAAVMGAYFWRRHPNLHIEP